MLVKKRRSKDTISRITGRVIAGMSKWQNRPLDRVYQVLFIDAMVVKIRNGQVTDRPVYSAVGVTVDGERDILGLWAGNGGEGARFWLQVLTEIKNRGTHDVCIVVCDGLKGLPEAIENTWPLAITDLCAASISWRHGAMVRLRDFTSGGHESSWRSRPTASCVDMRPPS